MVDEFSQDKLFLLSSQRESKLKDKSLAEGQTLSDGARIQTQLCQSLEPWLTQSVQYLPNAESSRRLKI